MRSILAILAILMVASGAFAESDWPPRPDVSTQAGSPKTQDPKGCPACEKMVKDGMISVAAPYQVANSIVPALMGDKKGNPSFDPNTTTKEVRNELPTPAIPEAIASHSETP